MIDPFDPNVSIGTRAEFVEQVRALLRDLKEHRDEWENATLEDYLEALAGWVEDMDGWFKNRGEPMPDQPSWNLLARMLHAAATYE